MDYPEITTKPYSLSFCILYCNPLEFSTRTSASALFIFGFPGWSRTSSRDSFTFRVFLSLMSQKLGLVGNAVTNGGRTPTLTAAMRTSESRLVATQERRDVLKKSLCNKFKSKFNVNNVSKISAIESIVGEFINMTSKVTEQDILMLEDRVSQAVGATANPAIEDFDKWGLINKYVIEKGAQLERRDKEKRAHMKATNREWLTEQVKERQSVIDEQAKEKVIWAERMKEDVKAFEYEEMSKMLALKEKEAELRNARDAQLAEKKRREAKKVEEMREEDNRLLARIRRDNAREQEKYFSNLQKSKAKYAAHQQENQMRLSLMKAEKEKLHAEDLDYMQQFAAILDKQEADRRRLLEKVYSRQSKSGEYAARLGASMAEQIAADEARANMQLKMQQDKEDREFERKKLLREHAKRDMIATLDKQVKDKEIARKEFAEFDKSAMAEWTRRTSIEEAKAQAKDHERKIKNWKMKDTLLQQMEENKLRRKLDNRAMSDVELTLNKDILERKIPEFQRSVTPILSEVRRPSSSTIIG